MLLIYKIPAVVRIILWVLENGYLFIRYVSAYNCLLPKYSINPYDKLLIERWTNIPLQLAFQ